MTSKTNNQSTAAANQDIANLNNDLDLQEDQADPIDVEIHVPNNEATTSAKLDNERLNDEPRTVAATDSVTDRTSVGINNDLDVQDDQENDLEIHVANESVSNNAVTEPSTSRNEPTVENDEFHDAEEQNIVDHPLQAILSHPLMEEFNNNNNINNNNNNENPPNINDDLDNQPEDGVDQAADHADDLDIYFVNENYAMSENDENEEADMFASDDDENEDLEEGEEDDEDEEEEDDFRAADEGDDYERVEKPNEITYNTDLPSSHNYLGRNFQDVAASVNSLHESNDIVVLPLLSLPGNSHYENVTENYVQLIPGQVMPIYFYSPLQTMVIRKRMTDRNPTVGFVLSSKSLKVLA
jgi:hypothetical protein